MKTIYVIVINLMLILLHFAFKMTMRSPLTNLQVTLMDWVVVAIPTTLLALQPNEKRIKGVFFVNVIKCCMPSSLTFVVITAALYTMHSLDLTLVPFEQLGTLVTLTYTFGGLFALFYACQPFNKWKSAMYVGIWALVLTCVLVPWSRGLLTYVNLGREQLLLLLVVILATPFVMYAFNRIFHINSPRKRKLKLKK